MKMTFKPLSRIACVLLTAILSGNGFAESKKRSLENDQIRQQGMQLIGAFSTELKANLKKAVAEGGLTNGIEVCALKAPEIAATHSLQGWKVKRTSLKVRNPANAPTLEEFDVLEIFESGKAGGKEISDLSYYRITEKGARREHHLMQAIPTQALCLGCHGENLSEDVRSALSEHYPADQATGFREGDIRGAFSLFFIETLSSSENK